MNTFHISKGRDIPLLGKAYKEIVEIPTPSRVAVQPTDFLGMRCRLLVREGDQVKAGDPVVADKDRSGVVVVSPASGTVSAVVRGDKRVLEQIIITTDSQQKFKEFPKHTIDSIRKISREDLVAELLSAGLWPVIRQRPFSSVADPCSSPKSIFVHAMNTEPLAADVDFVVRGKGPLFQTGSDILQKLTTGKVHLCFSENAESKTLRETQHVKKHLFSGPHPAGNVGTHIHYVDPIRKGDVVWYVEAQDVLMLAVFFLEGRYLPQRYVALTGEGILHPHYVKTLAGAPLDHLLNDNVCPGPLRYISGSVLTGRQASREGFLGFYDSQVTVIKEGSKRTLFGWLSPGFNKYSFSKTFISSLFPARKVSLDTDTHGSAREIVLNDIYDELVSLDLMVFFLLRAVISGDIEEAERLGILECDEEDFSLCTFACPSKTDVGAIIREGLDMMEKEG